MSSNVVRHPSSPTTVKSLLMDTMATCEGLNSIVIVKLGPGGAETVWTDQTIQELLVALKVFELDVNGAIINAREE